MFKKTYLKIVRKNFKKEGGFTLFELLVVIVMIAILSGIIFLPNDWQKSLALDRSANKLGQDISQSRALSMKGESGGCPGNYTDGYGIYLDRSDPSKYFIYRNCDSDLNNKAREYGGADEKFAGEDIFLENHISICKLTENGSETSSLSIFFEPPDPAVYTNGAQNATSSITICFDDDATKQKVIEINKAGNISLK